MQVHHFQVLPVLPGKEKKITTPPPLSVLETENFLVSNTCQTQTEQCLYVCTHMSSVFRLWRSWLQLWKSRTHCTLTGSLSVELAVLLQVTCPQVPATSSKQKVLLPLPPPQWESLVHKHLGKAFIKKNRTFMQFYFKNYLKNSKLVIHLDTLASLVAIVPES